jgi:molecular chaperone GrpE
VTNANSGNGDELMNEGGEPVVRDRRRIDPETGEVREPQRDAAAPGATGSASGEPAHAEPGPASAEPAAESELADVGADAASAADTAVLETALAERTADLQRLQAEYVNYKRRVDRDREAVREASVGSVLSAMLPVFDDIDRAREHGELEGGFKAVADSLWRTVSGLGLVQFGEPGDEFDPRVHEALMHAHSDEVSRPTCQEILQPGYRVGERILRPARVSVVEPGEAVDEVGAETQTESESEDR